MLSPQHSCPDAQSTHVQVSCVDHGVSTLLLIKKKPFILCKLFSVVVQLPLPHPPVKGINVKVTHWIRWLDSDLKIYKYI